MLSHFDAVDYYTGDDYVPQDAGTATPRHLSSATAFSGSTLISQWAAKGWFNLRDYLNEGGKVVLDGRTFNACAAQPDARTGTTGWGRATRRARSSLSDSLRLAAKVEGSYRRATGDVRRSRRGP